MNMLKPLLLLALILVTGGCASRRTNLIARTGGAPLPPQIRNVSLMPRASQSSAERMLETQLAAELQRRGLNIVPQGASDFIVAATIEDNWDTHDIAPITIHQSRQSAPAIVPATGGFSTAVMIAPTYDSPSQEVKTHIRTQGIRLRLYRTVELKQGRFQTAWEGYLEAGLSLHPEQQPMLLQVLCDYLGRDFIGHVKTRQ
jgi:hypothetical protein